jgi:hypothetical protein
VGEKGVPKNSSGQKNFEAKLRNETLGDFTTTRRVIPISALAMVIGTGVRARYGSERIRGHGIPEAIESIQLNGSRIEPKIALLKARARHFEEERRRERTLKLRFFLPGGHMAEEKDIPVNP